MRIQPTTFVQALKVLVTASTLAALVSQGVRAEQPEASATNPSDVSNPYAPDTSAASNDPAAEPMPNTIPVEVSTPPVEEKANSKGGPSASRVVEEIVVTAQKREENLQDVPISITAFSGNQLEALGIDNAKDMATITPGLQITDFAGYSLVYIRGIGTDSFFPSADSSVATYIDGVFFPANHTLGEGFGKIKRVEVLKGPQGTLFGRNATGGAINIVTEPPAFTPETAVKVSYGRFDDLKTRVYTNIPITDWAAVNVSGIYNHGNSYYKREDQPNQLPENITRAGRVQVRIAPTDDMDIILTGIVARDTGSGSTVVANTMPSTVGTALLIQPETRSYVSSTDDLPSVVNSTGAYYGTLTWKLPIVDFKLVGSHYKVATTNFTLDFDGSPRPYVTSQGVYEFQKNQTAELQLTSNRDSWWAEWLEYTAGLYYYDSTGGYDPVKLSVANTVVTLPSGQIASLVPPSLLSLLGGIPAPAKIGAFLTGVVGAKSYSGYLQATARPTDWLGITVGGRYQREKRSLIQSTIEVQNLDGSRMVARSFPQQQDDRGTFTPKVSVDLHATDDILVYLSYSQGYKSSTYNVVNVTNPPNLVLPEKVTAYELGLKSQFFGHNVRLNGAVFQNDIRNLQASFVSLFAGGLAKFVNAGAARIRGAEADVLLVPLPEVDPGLVVTGGMSYLHAIYTDFKNADGYDYNTGFYTSNNDYDGNRIVRTPKITESFGISQTIDTTYGPIELGGDLYHNSGFYFLPSNASNSYEPQYTTINGRVSYLYQLWNLRLTAFGANLTNERYNISQFRTDFGRLDTLAPPRTYGASIDWTF